jgi:hypothetical protein
MSLSAKVNAAVNKAFAAAGDLVKQGILYSKAVSNYDFATGKTVSQEQSLFVEVIIESTQKPSGEGFITKAIMKSGINISVYDTIVVNNITYNIIDYTDNDFVIEVILTKETQ